MFLCLIDEDKVVGTVALKKIDENTAELKALYIDSAYRGQGLGTHLMEVILEEAKRLGFKVIVLDSMKRYKDACKLYERFGFKDCDRYNDNPYADVFMRLDL